MNNKNRQSGLRIAMFTLYRWYRIAFAPTRKPFRIGLQFTHTNGDFCAIYVTKRGCAAPSLQWIATYRIGVHTIYTRRLFVSARKAIWSGIVSLSDLFFQATESKDIFKWKLASRQANCWLDFTVCSYWFLKYLQYLLLFQFDFHV